MNIKTIDDVIYKVHNIKVLNKNDKKAKAILSRAAEQVLPIMKKRRFRVELLSEFLPKNPNLLGLNIVKKSEIKIRLRKTKGGEIFHFNDIMGTLLHELVHIVHSRHDKSFYELLDKITWEYNELYVYNKKGISGGDKVSTNIIKYNLGRNNIMKDNIILDITKMNNVINICDENPKFMAAQAAEKRLLNNFMNNQGEIVNASLESCLTKEQRENLLNNRKKYDDMICCLDNDIILIDTISDTYDKENDYKSMISQKKSDNVSFLENTKDNINNNIDYTYMQHSYDNERKQEKKENELMITQNYKNQFEGNPNVIEIVTPDIKKKKNKRKNLIESNNGIFDLSQNDGDDNVQGLKRKKGNQKDMKSDKNDEVIFLK
ncbi:metallopeptidase, putative [Plasmodium reichenowi]|uniref:Metallopeptidase, putative n=1 Tax=Plasmodium reichenowi TaxID=5854 RepID=A0A2P9DF78_PLARE|nr:metallopeptidase, putative [Plasmodium reichenowi]